MILVERLRVNRPQPFCTVGERGAAPQKNYKSNVTICQGIDYLDSIDYYLK